MNSDEVGLKEARDQLGELVTRAQNGNITTITRNGQPAALIVPASADIVVLRANNANQAERLRRLVNDHGSVGIPFPNNETPAWTVVDQNGQRVKTTAIPSVGVELIEN